MKLSDRDLKLIILFLLVAIIALPIFFVLRPLKDKIVDSESHISQLKEREAFLAKLDANREFYNSSIALLDGERAKIITDYAEGFWDENNIFFLADTEEQLPIAMSTLSFSQSEPTVISENHVDPATGEVVDGLTAMTSYTTVAYTSGYQEFKDFLQYILKQKNRMVITSISAEQNDETGNIEGVFVLNQYIVTGEGRSLAPASEEAIPYGVERIFGRPSGEEAEEAPAEEEE